MEYRLGMIDMSLGIGQLGHDIKETMVHYTTIPISWSVITNETEKVHLTIMDNGIAANGD